MARRRQEKMRNLRWARNSSANTFSALSAGSAAQPFLTTSSIRETWMRFRGQMLCWLDGTQAPGVQIFVGVGLILMPEGQGTTAVSTPLTDPNAPWLYYSSFFLAYEEYVTDVIDSPQLTAYREIIDNKAMRIIRPDREIQLVVENQTAGGAGSINLQFAGSTLLAQA